MFTHDSQGPRVWTVAVRTLKVCVCVFSSNLERFLLQQDIASLQVHVLLLNVVQLCLCWCEQTLRLLEILQVHVTEEHRLIFVAQIDWPAGLKWTADFSDCTLFNAWLSLASSCTLSSSWDTASCSFTNSVSMCFNFTIKVATYGHKIEIMKHTS